MKTGNTVLAAVVIASITLWGCGREDEVESTLDTELEEELSPVIGNEAERPLGTFELGEEGAVDVEEEEEERERVEGVR